MIGLRTVTETAALADYFNRDLRRINNPGAVCNGAAEEKAWIAAISMGSSEANPAYVFAKGKAAREDALFAAAGCTTKLEGNAALGTRGDGANTPKVGTQQSPIFSQMSFEGRGPSGPMTLTLAKMGQAVMSQQQGTNAPELTLGTWTYVADTNRLSQIKVTMDGTPIILNMSGYSLCEAVAKDTKPRLSGCLSLQTTWAKQAKNNLGPVALFATADCSGSPAFRVSADTSCSDVPKTNVVAAKIDGQACEPFRPAPSSPALACERTKAGSEGHAKVYSTDQCTGGFIAYIGPKSNCDAMIGPGLPEIWGIKRGEGACQNIPDSAFSSSCNQYRQ